MCALHITDTGGSHYFPAMTNLAIQRGHAFLLIYSVNNRKSFENLHIFHNSIISVKRSLKTIPYMIVGNKCDCKEREVSEKEGEALAQKWNCSYIETSAKDNLHTQTLFEQLLLTVNGKSLNLDIKPTKHNRSLSVKSSKIVKQNNIVKSKCAVM